MSEKGTKEACDVWGIHPNDFIEIETDDDDKGFSRGTIVDITSYIICIADSREPYSRRYWCPTIKKVSVLKSMGEGDNQICLRDITVGDKVAFCIDNWYEVGTVIDTKKDPNVKNHIFYKIRYYSDNPDSAHDVLREEWISRHRISYMY